MSEQETYDEATRALAKALFAPDEPDEQQKPGNVVPGEGNNPTGEAHDMHALVKSLFYPDPDA
jgi:hypothetical protein